MPRNGPFVVASINFDFPAGGDTISILNPAAGLTALEPGDLLIATILVTEDFAGAGARITGSNVAWDDLSQIELDKTAERSSWWYVATRIVDGSEPDTITFSCGDGGPTVGAFYAGIAAYRGVTVAASAFDSFTPGDTMGDTIDTPACDAIAATPFKIGGTGTVWSVATGVGAIELALAGGLHWGVLLIAGAFEPNSWVPLTAVNTRIVQRLPSDPSIFIGLADQLVEGFLDGEPIPNHCDSFPGDIFVDAGGNYAGGGGQDGPGGPFGWLRCAHTCECCRGNRILRFFNSPPCCCGGGDGCGDTPRSPVPFVFGYQDLYTDLDASGPPGLEDALALHAVCPGAQGAAMTWLGQSVQSGDDWIVGGILPGDPGWHPRNGECWVFQCWVRGLGAGDADLQSGEALEQFDFVNANLVFAFALPGFSYSGVDNIDLTDEWQFFQTVFTWNHGNTGPGETIPFVYPILVTNGPELNKEIAVTDFLFGHPITHNVHVPKGELLIKCPHLYPCITPASNRLASFHGHG